MARRGREPKRVWDLTEQEAWKELFVNLRILGAISDDAVRWRERVTRAHRARDLALRLYEGGQQTTLGQIEQVAGHHDVRVL